MSWFPDALLPAGRDRYDDAWQMVPFYQGLVDLSPDVLLASWAVPPRLDDPRAGAVQGSAAFEEYARRTRDWLALVDASTRPLATTASALRSVEEVMLDPDTEGGRQELGAAVVAEWDEEHRLTGVRIYHGGPRRPPAGPHLPALPGPPAQEPELPVFLRDHHWALEGGEVDDVLDADEDDAVVVVLDRDVEVLTGREELRRLHSAPALPGAPARPRVCTVTDDGHSCAVEDRLALDEAGPPTRARVVVYERGRHGRIGHERRYVMSAPAAPTP